jgi:hypothetical protein
MAGIHVYEAWLDQLDTKLFVQNRTVINELGYNAVIQLSDCTTEEKIIEWAVQLTRAYDAYDKNPSRVGPGLPFEYLTNRFVRLVVKANHLKFDLDDLSGRAVAAVKNRKNIRLPPV